MAVAGTPIELVFEWSIAAGKLLRFTVHNVNLPKPKLPITGPAGVQATFDWQASEHPALAKTCTATLVNDLSADDFGDSGARIDDDGKIAPRS